MPGENGPIWMALGVEAAPLRVTTMLAVPVSVPAGRVFHGSWALIWPALTNASGAGTLLKVTETLASDVDKGMESAEAVDVARFVPKIDTRDPGVTACPGTNEAELRTPLSATFGFCAARGSAHSKATIATNL